VRVLFAPLPSFVTLNLFQGPFRLLDRSADWQTNGFAGLLHIALGLVARWILKQVQDDGAGQGGAVS
jgi:hypothetical protein